MRFLPTGSAQAECTIPGIEKFTASGELTVVAGDGAVYVGPHAFIMGLYALVEFREWSLRLARPSLLPFARQFFDFISNHRATFSAWARNHSDDELLLRAQAHSARDCENETLNCLRQVKAGASH